MSRTYFCHHDSITAEAKPGCPSELFPQRLHPQPLACLSFARSSPSSTAHNSQPLRVFWNTALQQLSFKLDAEAWGAQSTPDEYRKGEKDALLRLQNNTFTKTGGKHSNEKPWTPDSTASGIFYGLVLPFQHCLLFVSLTSIVYKLMNSLPATHLKIFLSCLLREKEK